MKNITKNELQFYISLLEKGQANEVLKELKKHLDFQGNTRYINLPIDEIKRLYTEENLNLHQIGKIYKVNYITIRERLKSVGVSIKMCRDTKKDILKVEIPKDTLKSLYYNLGFTYDQIGKRYGVTGVTIKNYMKRYGIYTPKKDIKKELPN